MDGNLVFASRSAIAAARQANFAETMELVCRRHPWYRRIIAERGLGAADFRSLADLPKLPVTTKADYMAAPEEFRLDSAGLEPEMQALWDVMHTAGTTGGKPTPFYSTTWDFFDILALQHSMMELRGVADSDVIANLFPLTVWPHGAYARVPHAAAAMNIPVVSALPGRPSPHFGHGSGLDEVVRIVERTCATILWGVPSYVRRVLMRAAELGADFAPVRLVFITGEATPETLRRDLVGRLEGLGAVAPFVSISYGATEMQGGMVECRPGSGYHNPAPGQFHLEIVDPVTHAPVPDGGEGLILLTHLRRRGTVLLRYALGDITSLTRDPCPHCGANTERLVTVPARADSLIKIKGTLVNPEIIVATLADAVELVEYQVVIDKEDAGDAHAMDRLTLRLALAPGGVADDGDRAAARIARRIKQAIGVTPMVELCDVDDIFRPGDTLKSKRIVDLRPKTG